MGITPLPPEQLETVETPLRLRAYLALVHDAAVVRLGAATHDIVAAAETLYLGRVFTFDSHFYA